MKFITILSIVFLFLFMVRILCVIFIPQDPKDEMLIKYAEALGYNPYYDALKIPFIGSLVCIAWLISLYF